MSSFNKCARERTFILFFSIVCVFAHKASFQISNIVIYQPTDTNATKTSLLLESIFASFRIAFRFYFVYVQNEHFIQFEMLLVIKIEKRIE